MKQPLLAGKKEIMFTYPWRTMTSPSTPTIWYNPEASLILFRVQDSSCVVNSLVECHGLPWRRCSSTRCTARAVAENPCRLFPYTSLVCGTAYTKACFLTCVTETMDEATGRRAVVSGVGRSTQHKQVGSVDSFVPGGQARQPPFRIFAVRRASRAREIVFERGQRFDTWKSLNFFSESV